MLFRRTALAMLAATAFPASAVTGSLPRIRASGTARVAIDPTIASFAMLDAQQQPVGSEVDTARLLCADLGVECHIVPVTSAARIPALLSGRVDLVISLMSITPERSRVISFSRPYGAVLSILAGPVAPGIAHVDDLVGKRVVVTRGSTNDQMLSKAMLPGTLVMRFDDDAASIAAVAVGQADYFATAPELLATVNRHRLGSPIAPLLSLGRTLYAIGLPWGDAALKDWMDSWVDANLRNGKLGAIYSHWHDAALPADILNGRSA
jgi:polar amino acid transport system substrate-binding protein